MKERVQLTKSTVKESASKQDMYQEPFTNKQTNTMVLTANFQLQCYTYCAHIFIVY